MHKERATTGASSPVTPLAYQLPEEAHLALVRTREHLLLLARLTDSQTLAIEEPLQISPTALAQFFVRLAGDLDGVIRAAQWPGRTSATRRRKPPKKRV